MLKSFYRNTFYENYDFKMFTPSKMNLQLVAT